ncbi:MAG: ParA family protein [Pseudomonadota bacterium]
MADKTRIVAIANQKGGVGKTTTSINLAAAISEKGNKTLLIDLDPQGNASTGVAISPEAREHTSYDMIVDGMALEAVAQKTGIANLDVVPSNTDLSSADVEIMAERDKLLKLRRVLAGSNTYDFIFIDCPPSLNLLTLNALAASDSVLVPLQSEFFALEGLSQLLLTIKEVREAIGGGLFVDGVVLTMFDRRNNLSQQVELDVRENLGALVYDTIIPRSVRMSEAPSYGESVFEYAPTSSGAVAYLALANEFLKRDKKRMS